MKQVFFFLIIAVVLLSLAKPVVAVTTPCVNSADCTPPQICMVITGGMSACGTGGTQVGGTGFNVTLPNPLCSPGSATCINNFPTLITTITGYIAGILGVLVTLMFVISGIYFVTSAGNPGRIETAKKIAIYAAIGAGIALAATGLIAVIQAVVGPGPGA